MLFIEKGVKEAKFSAYLTTSFIYHVYHLLNLVEKMAEEENKEEEIIGTIKYFFNERGIDPSTVIYSYPTIIIVNKNVEFNLKELIELLNPEEIETFKIDSNINIHKWKVKDLYIYFFLNENNKIFEIMVKFNIN